jgi:hypothetical protein
LLAQPQRRRHGGGTRARSGAGFAYPHGVTRAWTMRNLDKPASTSITRCET